MSIIQKTKFLKESAQRLAEMLTNVNESSIDEIRKFSLIVKSDIETFRKTSAEILKNATPQLEGQVVMFDDFNLEPKKTNDT